MQDKQVGVHAEDDRYYHKLDCGMLGLTQYTVEQAEIHKLLPCPYCWPGVEHTPAQDWYQDIIDFHFVSDHLIAPSPCVAPEHIRALRSKLIREETNELLDGLDEGDLVKTADGAADSIVVILGTCVSYGIDLRPIWAEVHRTNMAKAGGGKRADGKSLKPNGWQPPRVKELLDAQIHGDRSE